jgi:hypothetical protein
MFKTKLDYAQYLITQDFAIFPCEKNGKKPAISGWRDLSCTRLKTIQEWWGPDATEDYNIGIDCFKSVLTAVDIDVKGEKKGRESYEALDKEYGWPATFTVKTPTGGLHLYYRSFDYRNSVEKLAPGIDIRGDGGYVVAPGSIIDGKLYEIKVRRPVARPPEWLKEKLAKFKTDRRDSNDKKKVVYKAGDIDIDWAKNFLSDRDPAVEGAGGDHHTYATICCLKERGIQQDAALELLEEFWNPSCCPPWDHDELITKVENAYKYGQSAIGGKSAFAIFDVPPESSQTKPTAPRFNPGFSHYTQKVDYSKDLFIGVLSHDLRSPLNAILMSAQLQLNTETPKERQTILAQQIVESTSRIAKIVDDLLDVTRSRFGSGFPVLRAPMDMGFVSKQLVDEMRAANPTRTILLEVSGDLKGKWDKARIGQVFSNLIGNAIQYSFKDTPIRVIVKGSPEEVILSVHNQGVPIPPEKFATLFTSFTRAVTDEGDHPMEVNLGLGLFITEEIVVSHGGTIDVTSSEEEGTTFTARFPRLA